MFTSSKVSVSQHECLVELFKARFEANADGHRVCAQAIK